MERKKSLSQLGVGPYYVVSISLLTVLALAANYFKMLPVFQLSQGKMAARILAAVLIAAGIGLWFNAAVTMKIRQHVQQNQLVTTGAYAWVRNPIYSAFMVLMWGLLLWSGNMFLLILCPVYHLLMTVMVKYTEEKWLKELYGKAYLDYCKKVNRCIPWPPKIKN